MIPPIPEPVCRKFFDHFECQRRVRSDGRVIWVRSNGAVVADWRALLRYFAAEEQTPVNIKPLDLKVRLEALLDLE